MILTITSRVFLMLSVLAALVALPSYRPVEAQRQQDNRALTVQQVKELPPKSKRFALVIGVDEYQDEQISRLSGAGNDAKALADALVRYAGFPSDQVILLASDQPQQRQPNRGSILQYLSNLRGIVPEDGLLVFSFAGHGVERGGRGFLCPSDARIGGSRSPGRTQWNSACGCHEPPAGVIGCPQRRSGNMRAGPARPRHSHLAKRSLLSS